MKKENKMLLGQMWWMWMIFAVVSIIFGIATLIYPGMTLATMVMLAGGLLLIWGLVDFIQGITRAFKDASAWWTVFGGVIMMSIGVFLSRHPGMTFAILALTLGWTLISRSIYDLAVTRKIDQEGSAMWIASSVIGLLAGFAVLIHPLSGAVTFTWIVGLYAVINGGIIAARALEARSIYREMKK